MVRMMLVLESEPATTFKKFQDIGALGRVHSVLALYSSPSLPLSSLSSSKGRRKKDQLTKRQSPGSPLVAR